MTSNQEMLKSFLLFLAGKKAVLEVTFGNFHSQKDHENEVFLSENILHFVSKCTKHHNYVKTPIVTVCAL